MNTQIFHLSTSNLDGEILITQIPDNYFTKEGFEDNTIPRISFAPTVDFCTLGIGYNRIKDGLQIYYAHEPANVINQ